MERSLLFVLFTVFYNLNFIDSDNERDNRIKKNERGKNDPVEGPRFRTRGRLFKKIGTHPALTLKKTC